MQIDALLQSISTSVATELPGITTMILVTIFFTPDDCIKYYEDISTLSVFSGVNRISIVH